MVEMLMRRTERGSRRLERARRILSKVEQIPTGRICSEPIGWDSCI